MKMAIYDGKSRDYKDKIWEANAWKEVVSRAKLEFSKGTVQYITICTAVTRYINKPLGIYYNRVLPIAIRCILKASLSQYLPVG